MRVAGREELLLIQGLGRVDVSSMNASSAPGAACSDHSSSKSIYVISFPSFVIPSAFTHRRVSVLARVSGDALPNPRT